VIRLRCSRSGSPIEWRARGHWLPRVLSVSFARAAGGKNGSRIPSPAVCCAAARAPLPDFIRMVPFRCRRAGRPVQDQSPEARLISWTAEPFFERFFMLACTHPAPLKGDRPPSMPNGCGHSTTDFSVGETRVWNRPDWSARRVEASACLAGSTLRPWGVAFAVAQAFVTQIGQLDQFVRCADRFSPPAFGQAGLPRAARCPAPTKLEKVACEASGWCQHCCPTAASWHAGRG